MENQQTFSGGWSSSFPIFLFGSGRSGTTLLQKVLNSADDVMIWGEHGGFLKQVAAAYYFNLTDKEIEQQILKQNPVAQDPNLDFNRLKINKIGYSWMNWYSREEIDENFRRFIASFFNPVEMTKTHWGFKEIRYGIEDRVMEMLADLYREARFVFIVRNPLDVVASQVVMGWYGTAKHLAKVWAVQNQQIIDFCRVHEDRVHVVRFEELASRESNAIPDLFEWLGYPATEKQYEILEIQEGIWKKTRKDGRAHSEMFSRWERGRILKAVKAQKRALGY